MTWAGTVLILLVAWTCGVWLVATGHELLGPAVVLSAGVWIMLWAALRDRRRSRPQRFPRP